MAYQQKLTALGQDIIAETQTGKVLTFTRMQLGRGVTPIANVPAMTALVDPVMQIGIASVSHRSIGQVTVISRVNVPSIPVSFWLNEIGLFARADGGSEQLYAVAVADDFPDSLSPSMLGGSTAEHTIAMAVLIGTTENVTAVFDPDIACENIGLPSIGPGFYSRRDGNTFLFKRLVGSNRITLTEDNNTVRIDSPSVVPVGGMMPFAGLIAPFGWLMCDGASHSRAMFPDLAALLGTRFGGDATNFNVPNCTNRTLVASGLEAVGATGGVRTHALTLAEMPSHNHNLTDNGHSHAAGSSPHNHNLIDGQHVHPVNSWPADHREGTGGSWRAVEWTDFPFLTTYFAGAQISIQPATVSVNVAPNTAGIGVQNNGSGNAHTNMPPYLVMNYIIKT